MAIRLGAAAARGRSVRSNARLRAPVVRSHCVAPASWRCRGNRPTTRCNVAAQPATNNDTRTLLDSFLSWSVANGMEGLAGEEAVLALFSDADKGERGLACVKDVPEGHQLLRVPLRLAITDHPGDEESNRLLYEGAPWSVRLATKLLRERSKGQASPWYPYLQVLPRQVPTPLEVLAREQMQLVEYQPVLAALDEYQQLLQDAFHSCSGEALGGASQEEFRWAMSVVYSRTFGTAAEGGGVGVRMMVPLVDMLNHGGDECRGPPSATHIASDSVRWDLVRPEEGSGGGWVMVVRAVRDIEAGEELRQSYGERSNDDFLLHYGFVPPRNPHDDVQLWPTLDDAVAWHWALYGAQGKPEQAAAWKLYCEAAVVGEEEQRRSPLWEAAGQPQDQRQAREEACKVKVVAGSKVGAPVMAAFTHIHGGNSQLAEVAIARRCWQLLGSWAPLLGDLELLATDDDVAADPDYGPDPYWRDMYLYYRSELEEAYPEAATAGTSPATTTSPAPTPSPAPATPATPTTTSIPLDIFSDPSDPHTDPPSAQPITSGQQLPSTSLQAAPSETGQAAAAAAAALTVPLARPLRTVLEYRAHKKMILWDLLLKLRTPVASLTGSAPAAAAAVAAPAAAVSP